MTLSGPVLLVGAGRMGGAMIDGWLSQGVPPERLLAVVPSEERRAALADKGVQAVAAPEALPADLVPSVVVLAVKPQKMDAVLPAYARFAGPETVFLSVAAGRTVASLTRHLGAHAAVVRSIPNTPSAVGRGMTVLYANEQVSEAQRAACDTLLQGVGATGWVADENLMDAATAVSGSGPAYVFHMIEALARAGVEAGLPDGLAARLALNTVAGAGELARQSAEDPTTAPTTLRRNVTSPGGTTEAALRELMGNEDPADAQGGGLSALLARAVAAATARSRELAG